MSRFLSVAKASNLIREQLVIPLTVVPLLQKVRTSGLVSCIEVLRIHNWVRSLPISVSLELRLQACSIAPSTHTVGVGNPAQILAQQVVLMAWAIFPEPCRSPFKWHLFKLDRDQLQLCTSPPRYARLRTGSRLAVCPGGTYCGSCWLLFQLPPSPQQSKPTVLLQAGWIIDICLLCT